MWVAGEVAVEVQGLKDLQRRLGVTSRPWTPPGDSCPSSSLKQVVWGLPEQGFDVQLLKLEWRRVLQI